MISLNYDLHIHSCLSPCGDADMTPGNIVGMAYIKGLDVIAVTDHNSCRNCPAVMKQAEQMGILAIPGMEINTAEEVHALCLFPTLERAMEFDAYVYERLMKLPNREDIFGKQQIYDETDTCVGTEPNLLIHAVQISFDRLWEIVRSLEGVMVPAHIEKDSNSLIANLGMIPPDSQFPTVEVKQMGRLSGLLQEHPYLQRCKVIHNSDAHYLPDIQEAEWKLSVRERSIRGVLEALL